MCRNDKIILIHRREKKGYIRREIMWTPNADNVNITI